MPRWFIAVLPLFALGFGASPLRAQEIRVQPYLQRPTSQSMRVLWETSSGDESLVDWGTSATLGNTTSGSAATGLLTSRIHTVELTGLSPATRYHYRARTGTATSAIASFVTPPLADQDSGFTLLALSDTQRDGANPDKLAEIVELGVIDTVTADGTALDEALAMTLVVGDLVVNGWTYSQWRDEFFAPSAALLAQVPTLPVPGNHDANSSFYFAYFDLPVAGATGAGEHWWVHDRGNLRVIGLDSNTGFRTRTQLDWLQDLLTSTCVDPDIDFVIAQLHHPYISELWPAGELDWSGEVVAALEDFARGCARPTLYLYGHTHGYARGQSLDAPLLWVNVASASGNIDYWGEYAQYDADLFSVGQDEWGFVLIDVSAGGDPQLSLRRISRGNELLARDNEERDRVLLRRYNSSPDTPLPLAPAGNDVSPDCVVLRASAFGDPDGDAHQAAQWQLASSCADFTAPLVERWRQDHNWYQGVDTQAGDDLSDEPIVGLAPDSPYCWRVRYRDSALGWSAWSAPQAFNTGAARLVELPLQNPGAEAGLDGWSVTEGVFESLASGDCNGTSPQFGSRYFAAGLCDHAASSRAEQRLDLTAHAAAVDTGQAALFFGGMLGDWEGRDLPELELVFRDGGGGELGRSARVGVAQIGWNPVEGRADVPVGSRSVTLAMIGTRQAGTDNDSYFDALYLQLSPTGLGACELPDPPALDGGSDASTASDATTPDAAAPDATTPDADRSDGSSADSALSDRALSDRATADSAPADAANPDTATPDAVDPDAAMPDATTADAALADAATTDAALADAATTDAARPDTFSPDTAAGDSAVATDAALADRIVHDAASAPDHAGADSGAVDHRDDAAAHDVSTAGVDAGHAVAVDASGAGSHVAAGCGCRTHDEPAAPQWLGLLGLWLLSRRRRHSAI